MVSVADLIREPEALSTRQFQRFAGQGAELAKFLWPESDDVVSAFYEFDGTALPAGWTTNAGTGATAFAPPATALQGGAARGSSGTDATASNRRVNLYGPAIWLGNKNVLLEARISLSAITSIAFEVGLIDTMTTITTPAPGVTDVDTPAFASGMGDGAIVVMDTAQTLTTTALATLGSSPVSNAGAKDAIGTLTPTAATYMLVRLGIINNTVFVNIDRKDGTSFNVKRTSGINGATLLRPWFFLGGLTATSRNFDIDYVRILQDR